MFNKRKRTFLIITLLLICTGCGAFFYLSSSHSDLLYRAKKDFSSLFAKNPLSAADVTTENVSLDALLSDPRCEQNQAGMLINNSYPLEKDFTADISFYQDSDIQMNLCMQESFAQLSASVRELFDLPLYVRDAYRSAEEQREKQQEKGDIAANVGASEHQAGLALDVYVPQFAGWAFVKSEAGRYVDDHCHEYGFIVRYPSYGVKETGIAYEPWHLRFVGIPHAQIIMEGCLTLEEYMEMLEPGELYRYKNYIVSRQLGDTFTAPVSYESMTLSSDNMGGYLLSWKLVP